MRQGSARGGRAVLVGIDFGQDGFSESLDELKLLAVSAGFVPCAIVIGKRGRPDPALYAGSGKVKEVRLVLQQQAASVVIFNHELSPVQERNLEQGLQANVRDRTSLILGIFGQRARSHVGKLQVELAQLEYASTRLVRGWTHLERQRGGRGFLGGMGETQLEVDRRLIARRVKVIKEKLLKLRRQLGTQRRSRDRAGVLSVSLVGYTNAGKSTLFNQLTNSGAYVADQLFATLDTTSRHFPLEGVGQAVLSDTVGFIRELPYTLVEAFRTTLQEAAHADLLLHVVDSSSSRRGEHVSEVNKVLDEIGASGVRQILVWNKIDSAGSGSTAVPRVELGECGKILRVHLSAKTGAGVDLLRFALSDTAVSGTAPMTPGATQKFTT